MNIRICQCLPGGGPPQKVVYTPAEGVIINFLPDSAVEGVPDIPHPDASALAEGLDVADDSPGPHIMQAEAAGSDVADATSGQRPSGQRSHVQFHVTEKTKDSFNYSQLLSPSLVSCSYTFKGNWQQVVPGIAKEVDYLTVVITDHLYVASNAHNKTVKQPAFILHFQPSRPPGQPSSQQYSKPACTQRNSLAARSDQDKLKPGMH